MNDSVRFLHNVEIFSLLSVEELEMIIGSFHFRRIDAGELLFSEGDQGSELFIVASGKVKTSIQLPDGSEREVAVFQRGDFFGEMSIFDDAPRSATCSTVEKASLVCLSKEGFYSMIDENPEIAIKIMYRMLNITTQRLRDTGAFLSDMVQWGESARRRTIIDELTGAYNRRFLDDSLPAYYETARKRSEALSLIMVDLDNFRVINESLGQETGDRILLEVVGIIKRRLRDADILARYGGDEFTVLMPDTDVAAALTVAEEIRSDVESLDMIGSAGQSGVRVTTSQGLASFPEHAETLESLKEKADRALYRAKETGRNRVCHPGCL
ncbi:MAG: GGDEF domain-containing protein [Spirochaetes bacterium]|nr:GGDEF domain-containing protein [Spirochaetota bacterium]